ncbi:MAG: SRPBCC family protein [Bryobacteraceae bacterium]
MVRLEEVTRINAPIARCFDLARSIDVHVLGNVHFGESALAVGDLKSGLIGMEQTVVWRAKHFWIWQTLTSKMTAVEKPAFFEDTMLQGAFKSMRHEHFFRSLPNGGTEMKDVLYFAAPLPILGKIAELFVLRRYMRNLLRERNAVLKRVAESDDWRTYLPPD